ncbi:hypothetical protein F4813DRAFT_347883 [Daldinia decipiens]|uniref:uncharacterized protein n=1 Tax=Daldinia decipiens TaxID=326647 RepID=UPI0020C39F28|nr:uncharacterized protein F4813DRAFT_347883 [Daldinia decipiens]KAI1661511.1 hypothetical protein F4813DRAFT_347883 [Daldinia decipiens]
MHLPKATLPPNYMSFMKGLNVPVTRYLPSSLIPFPPCPSLLRQLQCYQILELVPHVLQEPIKFCLVLVPVHEAFFIDTQRAVKPQMI